MAAQAKAAMAAQAKAAMEAKAKAAMEAKAKAAMEAKAKAAMANASMEGLPCPYNNDRPASRSLDIGPSSSPDENRCR
jgi:hypothetical protein